MWAVTCRLQVDTQKTNQFFLNLFKMSLELASLNELLKHANECHNRQNDINIHVVNANIECDQVFR